MPNIFGIKGFDLSEYAISANAVLGIRDSGKTYTATEAAEELFDAGVPFIALDPIGVWHSLRIPGKGKGYPVVVAGGKQGDLPLTVKNAGAIVRAAMEAGVSLVIDFFSIELSKADWRRIVRETVEILLHENADHGLRHIFIEEAAEFVPQRVQDGAVFAAVEKLVRMGGNSKLGCTLINQRSADINKSVLELCANVFVHRQKGKNTLLDLKKWLSMMNLTATQEAKIAESLPNLKSGVCWALLNDIDHPIMLSVPTKNSQHPDRRAVTEKGAAKRKPVPADDFVAKMKAALAPKAAPAKASQQTSKPGEKINTPTKADERALQRAEQKGWDEGQRSVRAQIPALLDAQHAVSFEMGWRHSALKAWDLLQGLKAAMPKDAERPVTREIKTLMSQHAPPSSSPENRLGDFNVTARAGNGLVYDVGRDIIRPAIPNLGKAERAILAVLANYPEGAPRAKVALLAGYSMKSGSFSNNLSALRTAGLMAPGEPLRPTQAGMDAAGPVEPPPTGAALLAYWCGHKAMGKAERAILTVLVNALPDQLTREEVAELAGYAPESGSFSNNLSTLRTLNLISGSKELRAAEEFA